MNGTQDNYRCLANNTNECYVWGYICYLVGIPNGYLSFESRVFLVNVKVRREWSEILDDTLRQNDWGIEWFLGHSTFVIVGARNITISDFCYLILNEGQNLSKVACCFRLFTVQVLTQDVRWTVQNMMFLIITLFIYCLF